VELNSSTYRNLDFGLTATPAIEYNIYPYAESTKRQLRILYRLGLRVCRYREETIYDRLRETLWWEALSASLELKRDWGSISASLEGSHYFHDLGKNRLSLFTYVDVRLFKGLSFFIFGGADRIHDQLFLAKGDATIEEVLLQRRQLATTYSYFSSAGLSYTFGSTRSKVVNPRFGSVRSGGIEVSIH
jgi:hypothetical protein